MTRGRKVENKRLKIDKVRFGPVDKSPALILSPGRVPQERSDRTLSSRSIRRASERSGGEVEFPVLANGLVANPAEVSGSPDLGRGSAQTISPRGQPTAFTPLIYGPASRSRGGETTVFHP
ncbi:hypothetical protein K0M31_004294, partial [Melipona bicolor]